MNGIAYNVFAFISKYIHKLTFKTLQIEREYIYISRSLACKYRKTKHTAAFVKTSVRDRCSFLEFRTTTFLSGRIGKNRKYRHSFVTPSGWTVT